MAVTDATKVEGPPKVLLDHKGENVYSPEVVLPHFFEHFVGVLGRGRDFIDEVRDNWTLP
jgi:hypothetical protein